MILIFKSNSMVEGLKQFQNQELPKSIVELELSIIENLQGFAKNR